MKDALNRQITEGYFVDNLGRFFYVKEKSMGEFVIRNYTAPYRLLYQDEAMGLVKIGTRRNLVCLLNLSRDIEAEPS